jgi:hypothetical protein
MKSVPLESLEKHFQERKVKLDEVNIFQNEIGEE